MTDETPQCIMRACHHAGTETVTINIDGMTRDGTALIDIGDQDVPVCRRHARLLTTASMVRVGAPS